MNRCETCQEIIESLKHHCEYCESKLNRRYYCRDYTLDLRSSLRFEIDVRFRNLKRLGHYCQINEEIIDGVTFYLLYKSPMPTEVRYYPLYGRMQV